MPILGPTTDHHEIRYWAEKNGAVPAELLPHTLDTVPAELRFMFAESAKRQIDVRIIPWEEFFLKFDELGLTFVYDEDSTGFNQILQREEASPYRSPSFPTPSMAN